MFSMAEIVGLVDTLREGDDAAKAEAARRLGTIAWSTLNPVSYTHLTLPTKA